MNKTVIIAILATILILFIVGYRVQMKAIAQMWPEDKTNATTV